MKALLALVETMREKIAELEARVFELEARLVDVEHRKTLGLPKK